MLFMTVGAPNTQHDFEKGLRTVLSHKQNSEIDVYEEEVFV